MLAKRGILVVSLSIISITQIVFGGTDSKSAFIISKHSSPSEAQAFIINNNQVTYQAQVSIDTYNQGYGAVGNAVWVDKELMFVTYESSPMVVWASTKTLEKVGEFNTGISSCAGIAVDEEKEKIYLVRRSTEDLYVYSFDDSSNTLILEDQNDLSTSSGYIDAWGLALDEDNDLLYVSDGTNTVHYYNTDDWELEGSIDIEPGDVERNAIGVAIDGTRGYLYTGDWQDHNYLVRTLTNSPYSSIEVEITKAGYLSNEVIGIDVDEESGYVYCTTYQNDFRIYDCNLILQDVETQGINGPAGVAVGGLYVPPFEPNIIDDVEGCASPQGAEITYTICYSYKWNDENDPDPEDFDSLTITSFLPRGVDFVSASNSGEYSEDENIVTWDIDTQTFEPNCLELIVQINKGIIPGSVLENTVRIEAIMNDTLYFDSIMIETPVCDCSEYGRIVHVDADVNVQDPNGATWDEAFNNLQEALTITWPCDEVWVAEGTYRPTTNPNKSKANFGMINAVGVYGGFKGQEGEETERYERNWFDNETVLNGYIDAVGSEPNCVDYVVVSDANAVNVLDGFTVKGGGIAGIYCGSSSLLIAQHNRIADNWIGFYGPESEQPVIKNNWLYKNDYALYFESPTDVAVVRNNTIANNNEMGIYLEAGTEPQISNCILAGHPEDCDLVGCYATYSYIEFPIVLDPNATPPDIGQGNIDGDPNYILFVDGDNDNYLLNSGTSCIDAGDPDGNYGSERDIDKHFRVLDGDGDDEKRVDMGADEYCNEGTDNVADFNEDDIVDTADLAELASLWLADNTDPGWNSKYDLYADNMIDYIDFAYFAKEWHWMTCEKMQGYEMMEMMMGMGGGMAGMAGAESMLISPTAPLAPAAQQESSAIQPEPTVAEQIEQIKYLLDWLYGIKGQIDEDTWLGFVTSLEEMLKELEDSQ